MGFGFPSPTSGASLFVPESEDLPNEDKRNLDEDDDGNEEDEDEDDEDEDNEDVDDEDDVVESTQKRLFPSFPGCKENGRAVNEGRVCGVYRHYGKCVNGECVVGKTKAFDNVDVMG